MTKCKSKKIEIICALSKYKVKYELSYERHDDPLL